MTTSRDLVQSLLGSLGTASVPPITLLDSIATDRSTAETLAARHGIDQTTVYRAFDPLHQESLISDADGAYALTGLGAVIRYQYHRILDAGPADRDALAFIAASPHRARLLARLSEAPARKADLCRRETDPSRTTVHRAVEAFLDRGWVARVPATGQYATTADGRAVVEQYTALETAIEQALSRAAFLQCCPPEIEDIPLDALAAARQVVNDVTAPDRTLAALDDAVDAGVTELRAFQSHVSTRLAEIYDPVVRSDAPMEIITTDRILTKLPDDGRYSEHVRRGLRAKNVTLLVVPGLDTLPIGLAIHTDDMVVMMPATPGQVPDGDGSFQAGMIVGTEPGLLDWANDLYERYRAEARSPLQHVIQGLLRRIRAGGSGSGQWSVRSGE
jgi:predicted transcriptional regulator